jgi:hypothetical protein
MTCFGINYAIKTYFVKNLDKAKENAKKIASDAVSNFTKRKVNYFIVCNKKIIK